MFVIDRVSLANAHLALDRRDADKQLVVHHQQYAQVQQHHAGAASKDHDASSQQDSSSKKALGQLPENSQGGPVLQQLVLTATLHGTPHDHGDGQRRTGRDHAQPGGETIAAGLDLEADRMSSQQVHGHRPADQPSAGEWESASLLDVRHALQESAHEERFREEDPPFDPGNRGPEVIADDFPDVHVYLGEGSGQHQENGHREQGDGDFQRGNRSENRHDRRFQRRSRRGVRECLAGRIRVVGHVSLILHRGLRSHRIARIRQTT